MVRCAGRAGAGADLTGPEKLSRELISTNQFPMANSNVFIAAAKQPPAGNAALNGRYVPLKLENGNPQYRVGRAIREKVRPRLPAGPYSLNSRRQTLLLRQS